MELSILNTRSLRSLIRNCVLVIEVMIKKMLRRSHPRPNSFHAAAAILVIFN